MVWFGVKVWCWRVMLHVVIDGVNEEFDGW